MSIRPDALKWFSSNFERVKEPVYTSKYYVPDESWTKKNVWWIEVPLRVIDTSTIHYVNLICQIASGENDFHYLKVPTTFFSKNMQNLFLRDEMVSLYLSAEHNNLFVEERGNGKVKFIDFLVSNKIS